MSAVGGLPDEIEEPALLGVKIEAIENTPEPGTLALAGLGLAAVGTARLRRRAPVTPPCPAAVAVASLYCPERGQHVFSRVAHVGTEGRMTRMIAKPGLAVVALLAVVAPAAAEPIPWSYFGETGAGLSGFYSAHVTMGHEFKTEYDPVTDLETIVEYNIIANIGRAFSGSRNGSDRVPILFVGPLELTKYNLNDEWANTRAELFEARVTITDDTSGASRDLSWTASGQSDGYFTTGSFVVGLSVEDRTDEFVLGENHYTVRPTVRRSESADWIELDVTVSAAIATPEPGTLALAGIGLFGFGVARLRRR